MPKQRITKETVVNAAFEIARENGMEYVKVQNIAKKVGCSVQPVYSYYENMDGLRQAVAAKASVFVREYVAANIDENDIFASTGRAYVRLAREEPQLFKIFILHKRPGIASIEELYRSESDPRVAEFISKKLNIGIAAAKELHLNMLIYTIGIGTIFSVTTPGIPIDEIYKYQDMAYKAFLAEAMKDREETL